MSLPISLALLVAISVWIALRVRANRRRYTLHREHLLSGNTDGAAVISQSRGNGASAHPEDLVISYRRLDGQSSERRITPRSLELSSRRTKPPTVRSVNAYCHLRKADRTFLLASIDWAANGHTGEMVDDLQAHFSAQRKQGLPSRRSKWV